MTSADRYRDAGVDLDAAERAMDRIAAAVKSTRTELALGAHGAFGGMVRVPGEIAAPVLVTSTDGVGTKILVAIRAGRHDTIGEDLVNHCVDDILVHGATPIAFLDYIAAASIDPETIAPLVEGVARGCRAHHMTLTGGETAELPDLYHVGHYDLAGTIIGVVDERDAIHAEAVRAGDVLVGYASNGLHTNGYTLARRIVFDELGWDVDHEIPGVGELVGDALLRVHRSYAASVRAMLSRIHGLAHITGGGIPGNLSRVIPDGCGAVVQSSSWVVPPLFQFLESAGHVSREEMFRVFNMGVGMIGAVAPGAVNDVVAAAETAGVPAWTIGEVVDGSGVQVV